VNLKATVALLVVAAALGAWIFLVEIPGDRAREAEEKAGKRVLAIDADAVRSLEIPLEDGALARIVRAPADVGGWMIETPIEFAGDDGVLRGLISTLAGLAFESEIEEPPGDLSAFGLARDAAALRVFTAEGEPRSLIVGGKTPIGTSRYLLLADEPPRLFTIPSSVVSVLQPSLEELRDKRIIRLEPREATEVTIRAGGDLVARASRTGAAASESEPGAGWVLTEPAPLAADSSRIGRLLQDLSLYRATGFLDGDVDLAQYGLDAPAVEVELTTPGGTQRIALGTVEDREEVWARVTGPKPGAGIPVIFELHKRALEQIPRELFAYRFKQVLAFDDALAHRVEVQFPRDASAFAFVRDGNSWSPDGSDVQIEPFRIDDMVYALRDLEATALVEQPDLVALGLEPPRVRVSVFDELGAELGWLEVGDPDPPRGLAARATDAGPIWRVRLELGEDIPLGLEAFQNRWVKPAESP
jgi:hypothetical protein